MGFARKVQRRNEPKVPRCCGNKMWLKPTVYGNHTWTCRVCGKTKEVKINGQ